MNEALSREEMARATAAMDAAAIACPDLRNQVLANLDRKAKPVDDPGHATVSVAYAAKIAPSDRIYWVSTFIDGKWLAGIPVAPGPHLLEVEMHVITADGRHNDALYRIHARQEVILQPRSARTFLASVTREPQEGPDGPFAVALLDRSDSLSLSASPPPSGAAAPPSPAPVSGPPRPPPGPIVAVPGKLKSLPEPRLPSELGGNTAWATTVRVCVDQAGAVSSMLPLFNPPHPRLLGVLFDSIAHAEYVPFTINGRPVPYCYPMQINIKPG
jgi:hypothetical protein